MSALAAAKAVLEADATLLATATGGVWDLGEAGPNGLSRTTTGAAFDANEIIKPAILLKSRGERPDGQLVDEAEQYSSTREALEIYAYQDSGYDDIETMLDRCFVLLHAQQLSGTFMALWSGRSPQAPDEALGANVQRDEYIIHASKSG